MSLYKGKLFAGALFAGALFGQNVWSAPAATMVLHGRQMPGPLRYRVRNDDDEVISIAIRMFGVMPWV